ncbi:MAG: HAMP domain-containing sensor histidine kinase [Candidatus Levybacteria bacterium]|nr:HAMP domain-containing sensor histidine kinase [Candidatus Levybacteria bacterium]
MLPFAIIVPLVILAVVFFIILSKKEKNKIEFFHVMAHRFRSPISIIKWYVELLSDKSVGTLNDKQKEYFTEIYKASEKLSGTIESLIVLLQLQSNSLVIKNQSVDIKSLIDQILEKLQFKIARHKLNLQKVYPQNQTSVQGDPKLLNIIFENLIENAIRYTPENGNVSIKVNEINNRELPIEIKDNGYGIPKEHKSKILADSVNSKDMGFSLYLVKQILKKMGARINFKSEENKGTTFYIYLPS